MPSRPRSSSRCSTTSRRRTRGQGRVRARRRRLPASMAAKFSSGDVPDAFYVDSGPAPTWIDDGSPRAARRLHRQDRHRHQRVLPGLSRRLQGRRRQDLRPAQGRQHDRDGLQQGHAHGAGVRAAPTTWEELTAAVDKLKGTEGLDAPAVPVALARPRARVHLPGRRRAAHRGQDGLDDRDARVHPGHRDLPQPLQGRRGQAPGRHGRRLVRQVPRRGARRPSSSRAAGSTRT